MDSSVVDRAGEVLSSVVGRARAVGRAMRRAVRRGVSCMMAFVLWIVKECSI